MVLRFLMALFVMMHVIFYTATAKTLAGITASVASIAKGSPVAIQQAPSTVKNITTYTSSASDKDELVKVLALEELLIKEVRATTNQTMLVASIKALATQISQEKCVEITPCLNKLLSDRYVSVYELVRELVNMSDINEGERAAFVKSMVISISALIDMIMRESLGSKNKIFKIDSVNAHLTQWATANKDLLDSVTDGDQTVKGNFMIELEQACFVESFIKYIARLS